MSKFQYQNDDGTNPTQNHCRICFSENQINLIKSPCNCTGTVGFVHRRCLRRWIESIRNFDTCEICHQRYANDTVIPKRTFKKLFMAFFNKPFWALCKFAVNFSVAGGMAYVLSAKLPQALNDLNLVIGDSPNSFELLVPLLLASPIIALYCFAINMATEDIREFSDAMFDWWNYSWMTVRWGSNESFESLHNHTPPATFSGADVLEGFTLSPLT